MNFFQKKDRILVFFTAADLDNIERLENDLNDLTPTDGKQVAVRLESEDIPLGSLALLIGFGLRCEKVGANVSLTAPAAVIQDMQRMAMNHPFDLAEEN